MKLRFPQSCSPFANLKLSIQQEVSVVDIPRIFNITKSAHRIHNPFTPEKFAALGEALRLEPGTRVLDLGSGSGEMLCTWARDFGEAISHGSRDEGNQLTVQNKPFS